MNAKCHKIKLFDVILILFFVVLTIMILYPFYNAILISLVSENEYIRTPFLLVPKKIVLDSYRYIVEKSMIFKGMRNTIFITAAGVLYNMCLCADKRFSWEKNIILSYYIYNLLFRRFDSVLFADQKLKHDGQYDVNGSSNGDYLHVYDRNTKTL